MAAQTGNPLTRNFIRTLEGRVTSLESGGTNQTLTTPSIVQPTIKSLVVAKTADYAVLAADTGKTFTTVGAAGTVVFSLPAAVVGLKYRFRVGAAQELRIDPNGSETIALPSTGVASAGGAYITANADGESVDIECTKAGEWSVFGFTGTWTAV